jgi:hypothetical protein
MNGSALQPPVFRNETPGVFLYSSDARTERGVQYEESRTRRRSNRRTADTHETQCRYRRPTTRTRGWDKGIAQDVPVDDANQEDSESETQSFLIKLWIEVDKAAGVVAWRGYITHVPDNERRYVTTLFGITDFIALYLEQAHMDLGAYRWLRGARRRTVQWRQAIRRRLPLRTRGSTR